MQGPSGAGHYTDTSFDAGVAVAACEVFTRIGGLLCTPLRNWIRLDMHACMWHVQVLYCTRAVRHGSERSHGGRARLLALIGGLNIHAAAGLDAKGNARGLECE